MDWIYLWLFIGLYITNKKKINEFRVSRLNCIKYLMVVGVSVGIGFSLPPYNSWSRFVKLWNRVVVVDSWGPYVYQFDDIFQSLKPTFNNMFGHDEALKETSDYYNNRESKQTTNSYTGMFEGKNVIAILECLKGKM